MAINLRDLEGRLDRAADVLSGLEYGDLRPEDVFAALGHSEVDPFESQVVLAVFAVGKARIALDKAVREVRDLRGL